MQAIATRTFTFAQVSYPAFSILSDAVVAALQTDGSYSRCFTLLPSGSSESGSSGSGSGSSGSSGSSGGSSNMPLASAYYTIPAGSSTNGVISNVPVRVVGIHNTDSIGQGAVVALVDTNNTSLITTSHILGEWELGASQEINDLDIPTTTGLVWVIKQGDGSQGNNGPTALNSTPNTGVDVTYEVLPSA